MSLVLHPQNSFTVVRQIANHTDSGVYYVRAVIRNAYTDEIIATLDLTDRGGQRFSKNWQVPADPSGQGFYVSIVTSVYTDAGYTSKSENYGDEENTYLVQDRVIVGRGGGSTGLDAFTVRRIFKEELAKLPEPEPFPEIPEPPKIEMRWDEVLAGLRSLASALATVPKEQVDLAPVLAAVKAVGAAVEAKEVTPATDLTSVTQGLATASREIGGAVSALQQALWSLQDELKGTLETEVRDGLKNATIKASFTMEQAPEGKPAKPEEEEFDVTKIAS